MRFKHLTRWGKDLDPEHILEEYPRPGMKRDSYINLNGFWDYAITGSWDLPEAYDGRILVPFSPEAPLSGVGRILYPDMFLHYARTFYTESVESGRLLLHFGAVDQSCEVYINHQRVGEHTGGYLAFSFDITEYVQPGENLLQVAVRDLSDTSYHAKGKQSLERGGMWYTPQSGIWQSVWMEQVPDRYITGLKLDPDFDQASLRIKVMMSGRERIPFRLKISLQGESAAETEGKCATEADGKSVSKSAAKADGKHTAETEGMTGSVCTVSLPAFRAWTPEDPVLYDLTVQAGEDEVSSYFAMRKISMEKDRKGILRLFLNGQPYYHNGVLDQGYYPDGLYTAPSDEAMVNDILQMKALGFNMLRKHIKIEPERWYYHCDRLGMLVWQDMVCGGDRYLGWFVTTMPNVAPVTGRIIRDSHRGLFSRKNENGRKEFAEEVRQTVRQLYNHPSIVVWVPFNEGWGQFDAGKMTKVIKRMDPARLVDEASGWFDQGGGDIYSIHNYFRTLRVKPDRKRCIALTEFGGFSYHIPDRSWGEKEYGYRKYHSKEQLTEKIGKLWRRDLFRNIAKGLSASIYTQVSDIEDETNGFLTYDREIVKVDAGRIVQINEALQEAFREAVQ